MLQKHFAVASILVLCLFSTALGAPAHPKDANAILLDSIHVRVALHWTGAGELSTASGGAEIEHTILIWSTSNGFDLVGSVSSTVIRTTGDTSGGPDARDVFSAISDAAVDSAIVRGDVPSSQSYVKVYQTKTIEENINGNATTYDECVAGSYSMRRYNVLWTTPPSTSLVDEDVCSGTPPTGCICIAAP